MEDAVEWRSSCEYCRLFVNGLHGQLCVVAGCQKVLMDALNIWQRLEQRNHVEVGKSTKFVEWSLPFGSETFVFCILPNLVV